MLFNYHIGRIVLVSMCVGVSVWLGWSGIRVAGFSLQHGYHSKPTTPKLILRITERGTIKNVCLCVTCPLFLSDYNETLIFSINFRKILINQIS